MSPGPPAGGGGDEDPARGVPAARLLGLGVYNCNIYLVFAFVFVQSTGYLYKILWKFFLY